jgi:hypothetical protein
MSAAPAAPEQIPHLLYKYLSPDRLDVVANCRIRFSQRTVFSDDHELQPDYASFGTLEEIERHIARTGYANGALAAFLAREIAKNPAHQRKAIEAGVKNIKSIDAMGILCLTERDDSQRMWDEYAVHRSGFVVGFDTEQVGFKKMVHPLGVRRVSYNDEGIATFLGMMERLIETGIPEPLYRKRTEFSFEREWRGIRLLKDLDRHTHDVYLSSFDPECLRKIVIGEHCALEPQLREFVERNEGLRRAEISHA